MSSITDKSINKSTDSATEVKSFFDRYFSKSISITSNEVDSVLGFFKKRKFEENAAIAVTTVLLQQAKSENKNIFELLDSLKGLDEVKLSQLVAAILNNNRSKVSALGYTNDYQVVTYENRIDFLNNVPNKISEYLGYGLPIISTLKGESYDLMKRKNCVYFSALKGDKDKLEIGVFSGDKLIETTNTNFLGPRSYK